MQPTTLHGRWTIEMSLSFFSATVSQAVATAIDRNHTLPVLQLLYHDNLIPGVFPMVGSCAASPWFRRMGEALETMSQIMEVRIHQRTPFRILLTSPQGVAFFARPSCCTSCRYSNFTQFWHRRLTFFLRTCSLAISLFHAVMAAGTPTLLAVTKTSSDTANTLLTLSGLYAFRLTMMPHNAQSLDRQSFGNSTVVLLFHKCAPTSLIVHSKLMSGSSGAHFFNACKWAYHAILCIFAVLS